MCSQQIQQCFRAGKALQVVMHQDRLLHHVLLNQDFNDMLKCMSRKHYQLFREQKIFAQVQTLCPTIQQSYNAGCTVKCCSIWQMMITLVEDADGCSKLQNQYQSCLTHSHTGGRVIHHLRMSGGENEAGLYITFA